MKIKFNHMLRVKHKINSIRMRRNPAQAGITISDFEKISRR
jgi:hypothetical protein